MESPSPSPLHMPPSPTPSSDEIPLTPPSPPPDHSPILFSIDDALDQQGTGRFQVVLLLLTGICWTAESMEMLLLSFIKEPLQCTWNISDPQAALITTFVGVGMLTGSTSWGILSDRIGRKLGFILSTVFTFTAGILSAAAPNYPLLLCARGLVGFGIGGIPISFSLLMEFLPGKSRGRFGALLSVFWSLGAIFEAVVAMLILPRYGWRTLIVVSSLPLGVVLLVGAFVMESPRWYLSKGRIDDAMWVLGRVSRFNGIPLPVGELDPGTATEKEEKKRRFGQFGKLLRRGVRGLAAKVWMLWFAAAFVYYGLVMLQPEVIAKENLGTRCSYAKSECQALTDLGSAGCKANKLCVFSETGGCDVKGTIRQAEESNACDKELTRSDYLSTMWASIGELPGVIIALVGVEKFGRRPIIGYMYGITGMMFLMLLGCLGRDAETVVFFLARGSSTGVFQSVYLFTNEIYPAAVRASAMGVASSMARVGLILTPYVAQYVENVRHFAAIWIYFAVSFAGVLAVLLVPIETTNRALMGSMDELVETIRDGEMRTSPSFAKDPSVSVFVRAFRWKARVDGGVSGGEHQDVDQEGGKLEI